MAEEATHRPVADKAVAQGGKQKPWLLLGFLPFSALPVLVFIILFSASGLVAAEDFLFAILASIYICIVSQLFLPPVTPARPSRVFAHIWYFKYYVLTGGLVGLLLPLAYILWGFAEGNQQAVQAAVPHTFLLLCQVFSETVVGNSDRFSLPARAAVPIFYNTRRLFTLFSWMKTSGLSSGFSRELLLFGRVLAFANLAFWRYNLFGFLLPIYLPTAFRKYFEAEAVNKTKKT